MPRHLEVARRSGKMSDMDLFEDAERVAGYADGPPRFVPGFADLHTMTSILLAERAPQDAHVLVLGAGGGLELRAFADANPGWRFDGVDPSADMLKLAEKTLGSRVSAVRLLPGYIEDAPEQQYDAATCMLTLHFLPEEDRLRTLQEIRRRLKPNAPFVTAHTSLPQSANERSLWISRYAAFALVSGADPDEVEQARNGVETQLALLDPQQEEALLRQAGFSDVQLFYAAFSWRGWVAYA